MEAADRSWGRVWRQRAVDALSPPGGAGTIRVAVPNDGAERIDAGGSVDDVLRLPPGRERVRRHREFARRSASRGPPRCWCAAPSGHGRGRSRNRHRGARRHGLKSDTCGRLDGACRHCLSIRNGGRCRVAGDEGCCLALFPFHPGSGDRWENSCVGIAISAARRTQGVPWLCVPPSREVCLFDCYQGQQ